MSAFSEFMEALRTEQENDPRPIVGVRIPGFLLNAILDENFIACGPFEDLNRADYLKAPAGRTIAGIPAFIGLSNEITFDHIDQECIRTYYGNPEYGPDHANCRCNPIWNVTL